MKYFALITGVLFVAYEIMGGAKKINECLNEHVCEFCPYFFVSNRELEICTTLKGYHISCVENKRIIFASTN